MTRIRLWRRAWERWRVVAKKIANFQARFLLTVFYFVVVPPFALVVKLFKDPLRLRQSRRSSFWNDRPPSSADMTSARRQF